jgi:hypothetical protein
VLTFDKLLSSTEFVEDVRGMLRMLHEAYACPVDVEFTLNFLDDNDYRIHVVQCRPLPVKGMDTTAPLPMDVLEENRIITASGAVIGHSRRLRVDRLIYVVPEMYAQLTVQEQHDIARLMGRLNNTIAPDGSESVMLLGPGRWGTSCPFLGIPVVFAEISHVAVLCEIVAMRENLVPDVSLGTHFLNELIEMDMLYLALFPRKGDNRLKDEVFEQVPNRLQDYVPDAGRWTETVKVVTASDLTGGEGALFLVADALTQKVICYKG